MRTKTLIVTSINLVLQAVECDSTIRPACQLPSSLGPLPENLDKLGGFGAIPTLADCHLTPREQVCHFGPAIPFALDEVVSFDEEA
jgi:hypothetical protein